MQLALSRAGRFQFILGANNLSLLGLLGKTNLAKTIA